MRGKMIAIELVATMLFGFAADTSSYAQRCTYDGRPVACAQEIETRTARQSTVPTSESSPTVQQYYNGIPCSRAKRMGAGGLVGFLAGAASGALIKGDRKAALIGGGIVGGGMALASIRTPEGCGQFAQNSRNRKQRGRRREAAQEPPPAPAPSLAGQQLAIQFESGNARGGVQDQITSFAFHAWSSLGATVLDQPFNGNQNQSLCEVPGQRTICVIYGSPVYYNGASANVNAAGYPWQLYISNGSWESAQLYAVTVDVEVYDYANVTVDQWGRLQGQPTITRLASITLPDTANDGSSYMNVGVPRANFGRYQSYYSSQQLAQLGASNHATAALVQGYGWLLNVQASIR